MYIDYKFPNNKKTIIRVVEAIPDDWQFISGSLHASLELLENDKICPQVAWYISGKTLEGKDFGYGISEHTVGMCSKNKCPSKEFETRVNIKHGHPQEVVTGEKMPCGIHFWVAGSFTGEESLEPHKKLIKEYLEKGYLLRELEAGSGIVLENKGRRSNISSKGIPSVNYAPKAIVICPGNSEKGLFSTHWMQGQEEGLSRIVEGLLEDGVEVERILKKG